MHDFIVKRAVDFVLDLLLHSLRAPATNARHFYSCFQACILPPNFLTGSLSSPKLRRCARLCPAPPPACLLRNLPPATCHPPALALGDCLRC